jgi:hypothetical protein
MNAYLYIYIYMEWDGMGKEYGTVGRMAWRGMAFAGISASRTYLPTYLPISLPAVWHAWLFGCLSVCLSVPHGATAHTCVIKAPDLPAVLYGWCR